jgi:hypothetical protein
MDWPDRVGRRIDTYIACIVAGAALHGSGWANLAGCARRVASTGINAYRYALARPPTLYRTPRRQIGSGADAGGRANGENASGAPIAAERQKNPRVRWQGVAGPDPWSADATKGSNGGGIAAPKLSHEAVKNVLASADAQSA